MDAKSRKRLRSNRLPNNVADLLQTPDGDSSNNQSFNQSNNQSGGEENGSGKRGSKRGKHLNQPISPSNNQINNQSNNQSNSPPNGQTNGSNDYQSNNQSVIQPTIKRRSELDKLTEEFFTSPDTEKDQTINQPISLMVSQFNQEPVTDPVDLEYEDADDQSTNQSNHQTDNQPIVQYQCRPAPADLPLDAAISNPFSWYYHKFLTHTDDQSIDQIDRRYNPSALIEYDSNNLPVNPSFNRSSRGYVAYFFWDHYRYEPINQSNSPSIKQSIKPPFTYLCASVPTIFQSILDILCDVERAHRGIEVLPLINQPTPPGLSFNQSFNQSNNQSNNQDATQANDKESKHSINRIVKVVHQSPISQAINQSIKQSITQNPPPQTYETYQSINQTIKTRLIDKSGIEYQITAARKDQLCLIDRLIERLQLCPLLIDVYAINQSSGQPGFQSNNQSHGQATKQLVVGAGPAIRAKFASNNQSSDDPLLSPSSSHYRCTCTPQWRRVKLESLQQSNNQTNNQSINQTNNQSTSRPATQFKSPKPVKVDNLENPQLNFQTSDDQSINQSNNQDVSSMDERSDDDQSNNQSNNQSITPSSIDDTVVQSIDQSVDQPIEQSMEQSNDTISQSIDQSINQSIDQSIDQPINQDITRSNSLTDQIKQDNNQSISPSPKQSKNQTINQTNQSVNQSINQSINQSNNQLNHHFNQSNTFNDKERQKLLAKISSLQKQLTDSINQSNNQTNQSIKWENAYKAEKDKNIKLWKRVVEVQRQVRHMSRPLTTALAGQGRL